MEQAMKVGIDGTDAQVAEFTVAPQTAPREGELPYHEWLVEFEKTPSDMDTFIHLIDQSLQTQNSYYFDLIDGKILQKLKVTPIRKDGFKEYMKSIGKLGGQNKIRRLGNDRKLADALQPFAKEPSLK